MGKRQQDVSAIIEMHNECTEGGMATTIDRTKPDLDQKNMKVRTRFELTTTKSRTTSNTFNSSPPTLPHRHRELTFLPLRNLPVDPTSQSASLAQSETQFAMKVYNPSKMLQFVTHDSRIKPLLGPRHNISG